MTEKLNLKKQSLQQTDVEQTKEVHAVSLKCQQFQLHCALSLAAQCIVIGPVCGGRAVFVGGWVCYRDNWKLRASIFTKLGL